MGPRVDLYAQRYQNAFLADHSCPRPGGSRLATDELNIRGLTGVDITLRIAGPGTRAYAFIIDWHIRLLVALAWVLAGLLIGLVVGPAFKKTTFPILFVLPALLIYFFYHPVLEVVMRGRTPGKRKAGARIVTLEGATPGTGALLLRNLFRLIDSLPVLYLVGLVCCIFTAQRVRIGDLAAGTVLVLDETKATGSLALVGTLAQNSRLEPEAAALVQDLIDRWAELKEGSRESLARELLVRLEAGLDPVQLATLDGAALLARLEALLGR
ncbi:MAG: hypothetical protein JWL65_5629 [Gammaproteobacteria bacterium]|nr:hypothetical protein [Gammaproteobacteria bacterium]